MGDGPAMREGRAPARHRTVPMAERCRRAAVAIAREAGVERIDYHERGLRGRAFVKSKRILVPHPTTRRRLYVFAHECGHVALRHGSRPRHRQELEAELYAQDALRRHGIEVPEREVEIGRRYVAQKIVRAIRRRAKKVDRAAVEWAWEFLPEDVRRMVRG